MGVLGQPDLDADGQAFAALYRRHFGLVWSLTLHFGVPAAAREDVAQEVWLAIFRRLDALDPQASSRAWVASIARNVALHHHRTAGRRNRKHTALTLVTDQLERDHGTDALASIDVVLRRMDPAQREVFLLVAVEELSGPEAAVALGVPLNTVYSRLRLARARLAAAITELDHEDVALALRSPPPPKQAANRMWLGLATDLGWRTATPIVLATTWAGKLAIVAASAIATVIATAAVGGRGDTSAHAQDHGSRIPSAAAIVSESPGDVPEPVEIAGPIVTPAVPQSTLATPQPPLAAPIATRADPRRVTTPTAPRAPSPSVAPPITTAADTLAAESALLGRASRALTDDDPALARRLLDRHAKEFPNGALAIDRRAAWARMLCASGEAAQARYFAAKLVREHPDAPPAIAVRDVCRDLPE